MEDSDAQAVALAAAEFEETADKARGMLAALERLADAEQASPDRASPIGAGCR